ncbi:methyltransferase domain-containing protein [Candidatus Woesearchaeota archaeon]|nr:methyltransferase domain-containing protein [Candidatus Woesearchaeota archaeon]
MNHYAIKRAKENGLKAKLIDNNFYKKYNEYFDAVLLSHVLEHVDIPEKLIKDIHSLIKPGGHFILAVPQERIRGDTSIASSFYFLLNLRFELPHKHRFSKKQIFQMLKKSGLKPTKSKFVNMVPDYVSEKRDLWKVNSLIVKSKKINVDS